MGYFRAGFADITGVDNKPQPDYPFNFVQHDAVTYFIEYGHLFDAVHFSPPCQLFSTASNSWNTDKKKYPDLITPMRPFLVATGKPFVIENVPGAPLNTTLQLCGPHFGLLVWRVRNFETNFLVPSLPKVDRPINKFPRQGYNPSPGQFVSVAGGLHTRKLYEYAKMAMGIDWMKRKQLAQAIPPAYTEYIGHYLLKYLSA